MTEQEQKEKEKDKDKQEENFYLSEEILAPTIASLVPMTRLFRANAGHGTIEVESRLLTAPVHKTSPLIPNISKENLEKILDHLLVRSEADEKRKFKPGDVRCRSLNNDFKVQDDFYFGREIRVRNDFKEVKNIWTLKQEIQTLDYSLPGRPLLVRFSTKTENTFEPLSGKEATSGRRKKIRSFLFEIAIDPSKQKALFKKKLKSVPPFEPFAIRVDCMIVWNGKNDTEFVNNNAMYECEQEIVVHPDWNAHDAQIALLADDQSPKTMALHLISTVLLLQGLPTQNCLPMKNVLGVFIPI